MGWWNPKAKIPIESEEFGKIVQNLVFECPSSHRHEVLDGKRPDGKKSKSRFYQPVSARNTSFHARGISDGLFLTILGEITGPLKRKDRYIKVENGQTVEEVAASAVKRLGSDAMKRDLLVFAPRSDMPDTEAIFYYTQLPSSLGMRFPPRTLNRTARESACAGRDSVEDSGHVARRPPFVVGLGML
jgi:hypothetical protein